MLGFSVKWLGCQNNRISVLAVWITGWVAKMIGSVLGLSLDCKIYLELHKQSLSQKGEKIPLACLDCKIYM